MNTLEFQSQYERLQRRFGEKAYDKDFSNLLWKSLKDFADGAFTRAVDAIIGEHFRPVGKSAILEITKQESAKLTGSSNGTKSKIEFSDCDYCDGYGLIAMRSTTRGTTFFSCETCRNGRLQETLSRGIAPKISTAIKQGFWPERRSMQNAYKLFETNAGNYP